MQKIQVVALVFPILFATQILAEEPVTAVEETGKKIQNKESLPVNELRAFAEIFSRIKNDYVESVSDKQLIEYALQGMVEKLDPHSSYLNTEEYTDLKVGTSGQFGGLGIEVGMEDGFVKVVAPIDDTPAQRAGLKSGDLIIRLDGKPVKGMSLNDAVKLMRGTPGSTIQLTITREGENQSRDVVVERAIIKVKSIKSKILEPGFVYIRITNFQLETSQQMREAIEALKIESVSKGGIKGLILDLRNNPGGVLNTAISVSDEFLEDGLIVYTEGRLEESKVRYSAGPGDILDGAPIVALINGGSASASEIVAGALQDHKRAVIMGQQSFGKGSVQTVIPVGVYGALKMTTARYFTPSGRSIQAEGIVPDIGVAEVKISRDGVHDEANRIKEADLARHLNNGEKRTQEDKKPALAKEGTNKDGVGAKADPTLAEQDFALNEALNLLKGLVILSKPNAKTVPSNQGGAN